MSPGRQRSPGWRSWGATIVGTGTVAGVCVLAALVLDDGRAVVGAVVALGLVGGAAAFSLPVLAAMGLAPNLAFMVAMTTYGFQVVVGALLLRAGRPGGSLSDLVDNRWLGGSLVALAVGLTAGVVVDQLRAARADRAGPQPSGTPPPPGKPAA